MVDVQVRILCYQLEIFFQTAWEQAVVVAHADDVVARAVAETDVPVVDHVHHSAVTLVAEVADAAVGQEGFDDGAQILWRAVVNDDQFPVRIRLTDNALNSLTEVLDFICWYGN